ncbi:MAG TPA: carbohydrate kinase family protein [Vicinamibacteria bacterium]|nr:carbohydrate kinase family protein [Vicinamibacteria bacterium]
MKRVLCAGEINVDLILQGYTEFPVPGKEVLVQDFAMVLGSATAIMAMGLARLGTPVAFVGRVGDDVWGRYCLDDMAVRGIDLSRVIRGGGLKTGVTVSITHTRDRALVTYLGAINALTGQDVPDAAMAGLDHLHSSSFFFQEGLRPSFPDLFARARRRGLTTSLDTGFDASGQWDGGLRETLRHTDLFFPNEVELAALTGTEDPAEGLRRLENGTTRVVAKLGSNGAMTLEGGKVLHVPAFPVETVDTTGAGDSFNAGFLHRWLAGAEVLDCLRLGAACGGLSTRGLGGTATQPTLEEAEALIGRHRA